MGPVELSRLKTACENVAKASERMKAGRFWTAWSFAMTAMMIGVMLGLAISPAVRQYLDQQATACLFGAILISILVAISSAERRRYDHVEMAQRCREIAEGAWRLPELNLMPGDRWDSPCSEDADELLRQLQEFGTTKERPQFGSVHRDNVFEVVWQRAQNDVLAILRPHIVGAFRRKFSKPPETP